MISVEDVKQCIRDRSGDCTALFDHISDQDIQNIIQAYPHLTEEEVGCYIFGCLLLEIGERRLSGTFLDDVMVKSASEGLLKLTKPGFENPIFNLPDGVSLDDILENLGIRTD